jgi:hypothetical protein
MCRSYPETIFSVRLHCVISGLVRQLQYTCLIHARRCLFHQHLCVQNHNMYPYTLQVQPIPIIRNEDILQRCFTRMVLIYPGRVCEYINYATSRQSQYYMHRVPACNQIRPVIQMYAQMHHERGM